MAGVAGQVGGDPAGLLRPSPAGTLRVWPVARAVNTPDNRPECDALRKSGRFITVSRAASPCALTG